MSLYIMCPEPHNLGSKASEEKKWCERCGGSRKFPANTAFPLNVDAAIKRMSRHYREHEYPFDTNELMRELLAVAANTEESI